MFGFQTTRPAKKAYLSSRSDRLLLFYRSIFIHLFTLLAAHSIDSCPLPNIRQTEMPLKQILNKANVSVKTAPHLLDSMGILNHKRGAVHLLTQGSFVVQDCFRIGIVQTHSPHHCQRRSYTSRPAHPTHLRSCLRTGRQSCYSWCQGRCAHSAHSRLPSFS